METDAWLKRKYPHKLLTPTLHKIFAHWGDRIEYQSLLIGELSEEAQESKNKEYKKYRYSNTCKVSRMRQKENLFNMLSTSSDSFLSTKRTGGGLYKRNGRFNIFRLWVERYNWRKLKETGTYTVIKSNFAELKLRELNHYFRNKYAQFAIVVILSTCSW